jgi:hypothetical protein
LPGDWKKFGVLIIFIIFVGRKTSVRLPYSTHNALVLLHLIKNKHITKPLNYKNHEEKIPISPDASGLLDSFPGFGIGTDVLRIRLSVYRF